MTARLGYEGPFSETAFLLAPVRLLLDEAAYATEELVAELGAAFLCADFGISNEPRPDHAAYLAHWLEILRADKRALFTAASKAQAAADWLHARVSVVSPELVEA